MYFPAVTRNPQRKFFRKVSHKLRERAIIVQRGMRFSPWGFGALVIFLVGVSFPPGARGEGTLLREEMMALDSAFKTVLDAIVMEDLRLIQPALARYGEARGRLEGAERTGYRILLPKNQGRAADFFKLRDQFQIGLEELSKAAETGQKKVAKNSVHRLLDACVACHERFR